MAKLGLSRAFIYRGRTYGPGEVEVADKDVAAALAAAEERHAPAPAAEPEQAAPAPRRPARRPAAAEGEGEQPAGGRAGEE